MTIICFHCHRPMVQRIRAGQVESAHCRCGHTARPNRRFIRRTVRA